MKLHSTMLAMGLSVLLGQTAKAQFIQYTYKSVTQVNNVAGPNNVGIPAMNNSGVLAFVLAYKNGAESIVTGNTNFLGLVAKTGTDFAAFGGGVSINNKGEVAFRASMSPLFIGTNPEAGIYVGFPYKPSERIHGKFFDMADPSVNDAGTAATRWGSSYVTAYSPNLNYIDTSGIFKQFLSDVCINQAGAVAFSASLDSGGTALDRFDFTAGPKEIANTSGALSSFVSHDMNNAGTVVFTATQYNRSRGVFMGTGGALTTVAKTDSPQSPYSSFSSCAINNFGRIAFAASLKTGGVGIFIPMATPLGVFDQEVIGTGMTLFGSKVLSVSFGREGLNDSGQVAFRAYLEDGRSVIVRADPFP